MPNTTDTTKHLSTDDITSLALAVAGSTDITETERARLLGHLAEWMEAAQAREGHDDECENLPGGDYFGKTIGSKPIPCHCIARADGIARAEREIAREARRSSR